MAARAQALHDAGMGDRRPGPLLGALHLGDDPGLRPALQRRRRDAGLLGCLVERELVVVGHVTRRYNGGAENVTPPLLAGSRPASWAREGISHPAPELVRSVSRARERGSSVKKAQRAGATKGNRLAAH